MAPTADPAEQILVRIDDHDSNTIKRKVNYLIHPHSIQTSKRNHFKED
jgi:hypothetical protein